MSLLSSTQVVLALELGQQMLLPSLFLTSVTCEPEPSFTSMVAFACFWACTLQLSPLATVSTIKPETVCSASQQLFC